MILQKGKPEPELDLLLQKSSIWVAHDHNHQILRQIETEAPLRVHPLGHNIDEDMDVPMLH